MLARCPHCDKPFVATDDAAPCPHCGRGAEDAAAAAEEAEQKHAVAAEGAEAARVETAPAPPSNQRRGLPAPPPRFDNGRPAWEQRERSVPARFFGTLADACLRPTAFFTHLSREGASGVTMFAWICLLVGNVGQAVWGLVMLPVLTALGRYAGGQLPADQRAAAEEAAQDDAILSALLGSLDKTQEAVAQVSQLELQMWTQLLLAPLVAFFTIHLLAGLVHFSVQPWRHPEQSPVPYEVTYRFLVYSHAPMLLAIFPTVGGIASLYSFVLTAIAISKLHKVRLLGLTGGVLFPVMLLSWLWGGEVLPRVAEPLTRTLGIEATFSQELLAGANEPAAANEDASQSGDVKTEPDAAGDEYPPMPAADRDHDVEVFEKQGWLYTERTWRSSKGTFRLRQLVADTPPEPGRFPLVFEVRHDGDVPVEHLFLEWPLPDGVTVVGEPKVAPSGSATTDGALAARWPALAPGETALVATTVTADDGRALLERGAAVGLEPAGE